MVIVNASVLASAISVLYSTYDPILGLFTSGIVDTFWTTANAYETTANYMALTGQTVVPGSSNAFESYLNNSMKVLALPLFTDAYRDDHLWWTLAISRWHDINAGPFSSATRIYDLIVTTWAAWNETCGGMGWDHGNPYVNAITNELFLSASMRLHIQNAPDKVPVGNYTYVGWAQTEWKWFNATPMYQPSTGIFTDGLSTQNCSLINPTGSYWTYNQGVLLSGLVFLATSDGITPQQQRTLVQFAVQIANAALEYFGVNGGILSETSCGTNGQCTGGIDGKQFKGVFVRHLMYALPTIRSILGGPTVAPLCAALSAQASSLLTNSYIQTTQGVQFGQLWQGPYEADPNPYVCQGSALDALLAAYYVQLSDCAATPIPAFY
jgi:hypothetical protein